MTKTLFIMRGLPGSGKSTWARTHAASAVLNGKSVAICATDDYHIVDGEYRFNREALGHFHGLNQCRVERHMILGTELIFVDNTNIKRRDFKPYVDMATKRGYDIEEVAMGSTDNEDFITLCVERNTHSVPREAIEGMARKYQR